MVTPEALRALPLFADLTDEQLAWVSGLGREVRFAAGDFVFREGMEDGMAFFVFLSGLVQVTKYMGDEEIVLTLHRGGSFSGEVPLLTATPYIASLRALEPTHALRYDPETFQQMLATLPGFATTVLRELAQRMKSVSAQWSQHEKLASLGTIAAGLAHELNNPAAAIRRAAGQLGDVHADARAAVQEFCAHEITPGILAALGKLQPDPALAGTGSGNGLEVSDAEERLAFWLEDQGVTEAWDLAPALVGAGLDQERLAPVIATMPEAGRGAVLRWFTASLTTAGLTAEIAESAGRISDLVASVKQYSFLDLAPRQEVDVHEGLESTLRVVGPKLNGVEVVRDYDKRLPRIDAYGSELNQVWTNLIDNAIDAMGGAGTLRLRTAREPDRLLVEIGDTGPGIPAAIMRRIFDPFFTTKGVGEGTGLGLDIAYRIVVGRHGGDLRVESVPGDTRFQVRLPAPASA